MKTISTRRTIRKYADREVSEDLLNRLFSEAARTQTMGNLQLYSVVVTRSEKMKEKLSPAHFNQPMVKQAPVVLTICADFNRTSTWARNRMANPGYDNFLSFINATTDALLFTQTLCNLMDEEGLGYCYLGTTVYMPQMIIDETPTTCDACSHTYRWLASRRASPLRPSAQRLVCAQRDLQGLHTCRHRHLLSREGIPAREPPFLRDQPERDARTDLHRHPLYEGLLETLKHQGFL